MHLLLARCRPDAAPVRALEDAFLAAARDPDEPRVTRVSTLDLSAGPRIGRFRAAFGFGWTARDWVRRVEEQAGGAVDAAVELCLGDAHHLLGLGRLGLPTARWVGHGAARTWVDVLAAREGTPVLPPRGAKGDASPDAVVRECLDALDGVARALGRATVRTGPLGSGKA